MTCRRQCGAQKSTDAWREAHNTATVPPPTLPSHSHSCQLYRVSERRRRNAPIFQIINDPLWNTDDKRLPASAAKTLLAHIEARKNLQQQPRIYILVRSDLLVSVAKLLQLLHLSRADYYATVSYARQLIATKLLAAVLF